MEETNAEQAVINDESEEGAEHGDMNEERGQATVLSAEELAAVRELALRAYPETVPELVGGESVAALLGSLEPAAAAYRRIAEGMASGAAAPVLPTVPAGSAPPVAIDPDRLPAVEKIRRGLAQR